MKKINNWNSFNEGIAEFRKSTTILTDIVNRIDSNKVSDLTFGDRFNPSVSFVFNNKPFKIILADRIGLKGNFSNVKIFSEDKEIGTFKVNELQKVIDLILST
jgi:hypothetical protein